MIKVNEKFSVFYEKNKINKPYLARIKTTGALVLVGKHSIIVINKLKFNDHEAGDGWDLNKLGEDTIIQMFEPLKPNEIIELSNKEE